MEHPANGQQKLPLRKLLLEDTQMVQEAVQVNGHTRTKKKKSVRADLYEALPVKKIYCDVPENERFCRIVTLR